MKFKPVYLYGLVFIALAVFLVIMSEMNGNTSEPNSELTQENMPKDDIHSQFQNPASTEPNKENVNADFHQHLETLKKAVKDNPNDTTKIRVLADFLSAAHKSDEAIGYYNQILNIDPARKDIRFSLSFIYYTRGDLTACEEQNNKVLEFHPDDEMALYNLGAIAATKGNKVKAKELWEKIISKNPHSETGKLASESLLKL